MDCHANQMISAGVKLIRLEWLDTSGAGGLYHLDNIDELARAAERDTRAAALLLETTLRSECYRSSGQRNDWPDLLLEDMRNNASTEIGEWAEVNGLARETVSRRFGTAALHPQSSAPSCGHVRRG